MPMVMASSAPMRACKAPTALRCSTSPRPSGCVRSAGAARSCCWNGAATLRFAADPAVRGDWVRPGIMVYGSSPDFPAHDLAHWDLQPTMTLRAQLIGTQALSAGTSVGYGSTFTADRAMQIGVVACGYADGYPRLAPTGTPVLVDGVRTRLLGRV